MYIEAVFFSVSQNTGFDRRFFYSWGFKEGKRVPAETCNLLDYTGHRLTVYNVSQMSLLDLDSVDVT